MSKVRLPKQVDPQKCAIQRSDYQGVMAADDMGRLNDFVVDILDEVTVGLRFEIDAQNLTFFHGDIATRVSLVCQRCNEPFGYTIEQSFSFTPIKEGQAVDDIPDVYDPVELNEHGEINLLELLEDEIIVSLPLVPMHDEKDCKVTKDDLSFGEIEPDDKQPNPFAVLKELKRNQE